MSNPNATHNSTQGIQPLKSSLQNLPSYSRKQPATATTNSTVTNFFEPGYRPPVMMNSSTGNNSHKRGSRAVEPRDSVENDSNVKLHEKSNNGPQRKFHKVISQPRRYHRPIPSYESRESVDCQGRNGEYSDEEAVDEDEDGNGSGGGDDDARINFDDFGPRRYESIDVGILPMYAEPPSM